MFLKSMTILSFVFAAGFASADTYKIETKEGVREIAHILENAGPGCAMGGVCGVEATDVQCSWNLNAIGKLESSCEYHSNGSSLYITGTKAYKLIGYMQVAGVILEQGIPGAMQTPAVQLKCVMKSAIPEASRPESYICEFSL